MSKSEGLAAIAAAAVGGVQSTTSPAALSAGSASAAKPAGPAEAADGVVQTTVAPAAAALPASVDAAGGLDVAAIQQAERGRILMLDGMTLPGCEAIIESAKSDGTTPEAAAVEMVKHLKASGALDISAAMAKGAETVPALAAAASDPVGQLDAAANVVVPQNAEGWSAEYKASADLQAEFGTEAAYLGFKKATASGRSRILNSKGDD